MLPDHDPLFADAIAEADAPPEPIPDAAGLPDHVKSGSAGVKGTGEDDPSIIDRPVTTDE